MEAKKNVTYDTTAIETMTIEPIDWRSQFIEEHHQCPLCGSELLLTNVTHFVNQEVREEAHCEGCNIRVRQATHSLQ